MTKVRIDGYRHYTNKDTGEVKTVVYYSTDVKDSIYYDAEDPNCYGFVHAPPAWIDGFYDYKVNDFYELVFDIDFLYGKVFPALLFHT